MNYPSNRLHVSFKVLNFYFIFYFSLRKVANQWVISIMSYEAQCSIVLGKSCIELSMEIITKSE